ncbi:MAG: c-type cytochrome [Cocleimonas sp.]|nr:c-type cytochrome [Cocleimonas sp.]
MKVILPLLFFIMMNIATTTLAKTTHDIDIKKFKFSPAKITIDVGDTIRWTNKEKRQYHSVWFEQLGEPEPQYFFPNEFYERSFDKAGDFPYRCGPHPKMTGIVHVQQAGKKQPSVPKTKSVIKVEDSSTAITTNKTSSEISQKRREEILYLLKHDCGSCHGMTLKGGLGPSLTPDSINKMSTEQIVATITYGRPGTPMPPWKPFFNEKETLWLAQQLQKGIEDKKE